MSVPLVYVDTSDVREGALEELKDAVNELVELIDANEPRLISYNVYLSDGGDQMTVVHVHPDSASFDHHMTVGGPVFGTFAGLLTLRSIHVYGEPSESALRQLHDKARSLGGAKVIEHALHAGFSRLGHS